MRHRVKGNELNIDMSHRRALNRFMATSFVEKGYMTTTLARAKFVQPYIERLVTKAKDKSISTIRVLQRGLDTRASIDFLLETVAPKFLERNGGYTRLTKLMSRRGDNAPMAKLEWVESFEVLSASKDPKQVKKTKVVISQKKSKTVQKGEVKKSKKVVKPTK